MTTVLILILFNIFLCFISSLRLEGLCPHLFLHCPFTFISQSGRLTDTVPHSHPCSLPPIKSGLETWSGLQTRGAAAEQLSEDRDQCQHWGIYIQKKKLTWSEGTAFMCVSVCVFSPLGLSSCLYNISRSKTRTNAQSMCVHTSESHSVEKCFSSLSLLPIDWKEKCAFCVPSWWDHVTNLMMYCEQKTLTSANKLFSNLGLKSAWNHRGTF